jgi:hypothetical protein
MHEFSRELKVVKQLYSLYKQPIGEPVAYNLPLAVLVVHLWPLQVGTGHVALDTWHL